MSPLETLVLAVSGAVSGLLLLALMRAVELYFERHPPDDDDPH